jgi:hypothetical protein
LFFAFVFCFLFCGLVSLSMSLLDAYICIGLPR